jgi:hypothetical protein
LFGATSNANADSSRQLVHTTNKSIYSTACKSKILKNSLSKATTAVPSSSSTYHTHDNANLNSNYVSSRYLQQTTTSCYCGNNNVNSGSNYNCGCVALGDRNLNKSYKADRSLRLSDKSPVFKRNVSTTTTASLINQQVETTATASSSSSNITTNNAKTFLFNKNNLSPSNKKRSSNLVRHLFLHLVFLPIFI